MRFKASTLTRINAGRLLSTLTDVITSSLPDIIYVDREEEHDDAGSHVGLVYIPRKGCSRKTHVQISEEPTNSMATYVKSFFVSCIKTTIYNCCFAYCLIS